MVGTEAPMNSSATGTAGNEFNPDPDAIPFCPRCGERLLRENRSGQNIYPRYWCNDGFTTG